MTHVYLQKPNFLSPFVGCVMSVELKKTMPAGQTHVGGEGAIHKLLPLQVLGLSLVPPVLEVAQAGLQVLDVVLQLVHAPAVGTGGDGLRLADHSPLTVEASRPQGLKGDLLYHQV